MAKLLRSLSSHYQRGHRQNCHENCKDPERNKADLRSDKSVERDRRRTEMIGWLSYPKISSHGIPSARSWEEEMSEMPDFPGALGEIRTPDPQIRSLVLYPAELRAHCHKVHATPEGQQRRRLRSRSG